MEAEGVPIQKLAELSESNAVMLIKACDCTRSRV